MPLSYRFPKDKVTDDDIFLKSLQRVDFALDGGVGQHLGGLLEGSGRQEGIGSQSGFTDAEKYRIILSLAQGFAECVLLASLVALLDLVVGDVDLVALGEHACKQIGVARVG